MIREFRLENFKSYKKATLPLSTLTLLIGANASGKSNLLEGLRLFSWIARGNNLTDYPDEVTNGELEIRGGRSTLTYTSNRFISFGCSLEQGFEGWTILDTRMRLSSFSSMLVEDEKVGSTDDSILYSAKGVMLLSPFTDKYERYIEVAYLGSLDEAPPIYISDERAVFTQLNSPSLFLDDKARQIVPVVTEQFRYSLEQILLLDPIPSQMRGYSFAIGKPQLRHDAANLSSVLYNLCQFEDIKSQILKFVCALPEQDIRNIEFVETSRGEVMVELVESFGNQEKARDADVLSDGTLRVLAIAAALFSVDEGSLVVIEEIDNGVHPSRAKLLIDNIYRVAQERGLQVLLTTHNPALLDALPLEVIPNVVACYRDPEEGDSRLVRLDDLHDYPELVARGPIGSLMTRGILDQYLKSRLTPEQKKEASLEWLESFEAEVKDL